MKFYLFLTCLIIAAVIRENKGDGVEIPKNIRECLDQELALGGAYALCANETLQTTETEIVPQAECAKLLDDAHIKANECDKLIEAIDPEQKRLALEYLEEREVV